MYSRIGNPNRTAFETAIASLEGAKYASAFSSGTAVISAVLGILTAGSHLIASDAIYGGTYENFAKIAQKHGIETTITDLRDPTHIAGLFKSNTKVRPFLFIFLIDYGYLLFLLLSKNGN